MNIELRRIRYRPETIDGQIWIDGEKICSSAENARHALPVGTYGIRLKKSKKYGRKMPSLIADRSSLIAIGNGVYALKDGCIIVGRHCIPGIVTHSRPAFDALYQRIRKNIERGNPVNITISSIYNLYRL